MSDNLIDGKLPLIAILRGIQTYEAINYVEKLIDLGYYFIEVPLNSPNSLETISILQQKFGTVCCIGAGTVTNVTQLHKVIETGAKLIVTPNTNVEVIRVAKQNNCIIFVGVMTPTEAFMAIEQGAVCLKIYPAEVIGTLGLKAMKAVLPSNVRCFPVGGIIADSIQMEQYMKSGASGFGIGSALYSVGMSLDEFVNRAIRFKQSYQQASNNV